MQLILISILNLKLGAIVFPNHDSQDTLEVYWSRDMLWFTLLATAAV